jgi:hypothetical protein
MVTRMQLNQWRLAAGLALLVGAAPQVLAQAAIQAPAADAVLATPAVDQPLTINALLGTVDGQPLFVQDVFGATDEALRTLAAKSKNLRDFREGAHDLLARELQNQILSIVMYHAARDSLSDDDRRRVALFVEVKRKELLSQYSGSAALAEEALHARGKSLDSELDRLRRSATSELYFRRNFWHRITVTRRQLLDAYEQDVARFTVPAQVDLYTITLRVKDFLPTHVQPGSDAEVTIANPSAAQLAAAREQALAKARALIQQLNHGADFARLAEDNSQDPYANNGGRRRPAVKKGDLASPALEDYAFSLPANVVGDHPLVLDNSRDPERTEIVIVKVGAVEQGRVIPFAEAQTALKAEITRRQEIALQDEYTQTMLKAASIEAVGGTINTPADVATQRMLSIALDAAIAKYAM